MLADPFTGGNGVATIQPRVLAARYRLYSCERRSSVGTFAVLRMS